MKTETPMDATGLTQLSSREQLSALMDGALPADETRFLLRRLQHDGSLAECWERWRLSAEVMRGLAPAQRLPADFASRVAASLRGDDQRGDGFAGTAATGGSSLRTPAWLRWGGGAAVAASLAVVALMIPPTALDRPGNDASKASVVVTDTAPSLSNDNIAASQATAPETPAPNAPAQDPAGAGLESQTAALASAVAVMVRPARAARRDSPPRAPQAASMLVAADERSSADVGIAAANNRPSFLPQADIITHPWPRSVLPQYGNTGITVGFGDVSGSAARFNPFEVRAGMGNLPSALLVLPTAQGATSSVTTETSGATQDEPPQP